MWYPILKTEDKAACEVLAKKINEALDRRALIKYPQTSTSSEVAKVDVYDLRGGREIWEVSVDLDHNGIVCGWLGLNGLSHIDDHGQGAKGKRTPGLEKCEAKASKWLENHAVETPSESNGDDK